MDKFWNLMYDFFVFSLPGAFIISAFLIPYNFYNNVYELVGHINGLEFSFLLIMAVAGYIVGYLITPIARILLLLWVICYIRIKREKKTASNLYKHLKNDNRPKDFVLIREKSLTNHKYIEFWNMHLTMAHNLALASIVFYVIQICKASMDNAADFAYLLWTTIICIFSVIVFLCISFKFSSWWVGDIKVMKKRIKNEKH